MKLKYTGSDAGTIHLGIHHIKVDPKNRELELTGDALKVALEQSYFEKVEGDVSEKGEKAEGKEVKPPSVTPKKEAK